MSYVILRPADLLAEPDLEDFNPVHLTHGARIYYDMSTSVYYSDNIKEVDINKIVKVK